MVYNIDKLKNQISEALVNEICEMFQMIRQLKRIQASQGPDRPKLTVSEAQDKLSDFWADHTKEEFVKNEEFIEDQLVYNEMLADGQDPFSTEYGYVADGYEIDGYDLGQLFSIFSYKNTIDQLSQNINYLFKIQYVLEDGYCADGYYELDLNPQYNENKHHDINLDLRRLENIEHLLLSYRYAKEQENARGINTRGTESNKLFKPLFIQTDQDKNGI